MNQSAKFLTIAGLILMGLSVFLMYLGVFAKVKINEKKTGPYTYIYSRFIGDYKKSGPVFEKVDTALRSVGIKSTLGIGVYYDNPQITSVDKLRSDCGTIIENADLEKIKTLGKEYKLGKLSEDKRIVVKFPIKNMFSFFIGPMKVYPAMMKYALAQDYQIETCGYEVYDMENKVIYYMMDIVNN